MNTLQPDEFPHMPPWVELDDDKEPEPWRINRPNPKKHPFRDFYERESDEFEDFEDDYSDTGGDAVEAI